MLWTILAVVSILALVATGSALIWTSRQWFRARQQVEQLQGAADRRGLEHDATIRRLSAWLESLPVLAAAIRAATTPEGVARALTAGLGHLIPDCRALMLGREPTGELVARAGHGLPEWSVRKAREAKAGPLAALASRGGPIPLDAAAWRALGQPELTPYLPGRVTAVPMRAAGQIVGLLLVTTGRPEPLPSLHLAIVILLSDTAAAALGAAPTTAPALLPPPPAAPALPEGAERTISGLQAEFSQAFASVTALLGSEETIDGVAMTVERTTAARPEVVEICDIITNAFQRGLAADASTIHHWDDYRLALHTHVGLDRSQVSALMRQPAEALDQAARERRPTPGQQVAATGHRGHLAVPIVRGQDLLGVASVYWRQPHPVSSQDLALGGIYAGLAALALDNVRLYGMMMSAVERASVVLGDRETIVSQFLTALGTLADGSDAATASANHARRVADWAGAIAGRLGLRAGEQAAVRAAALVHDLGYLNASAADPTDTTDLAVAHPRWAARFLAQLPFLRGLAPIVLHHHEHYDGTGFPRGLAGRDIPLGARILAVANAFVVLTSPTAPGRIAPLPLPARLPCAADQAVALIQAAAGRQFDPPVVAALAAEVTQAATTPAA